MRTLLLAAIAVIASGTGLAQAPAPKFPPPPTLPQLPVPPTPPGEFGVDTLPLPPTDISQPFVRPPMPVSGAPIEVPPGPHVWLDFECLMSRAKGGLLPALVTAAYAVPTQTTPDPCTAFMINDNRINGDIRPGMRIGAGYWLDKPHGTGVEAPIHAFRTRRRCGDLYGQFGNVSVAAVLGRVARRAGPVSAVESQWHDAGCRSGANVV